MAEPGEADWDDAALEAELEAALAAESGEDGGQDDRRARGPPGTAAARLPPPVLSPLARLPAGRQLLTTSPPVRPVSQRRQPGRQEGAHR